MSEHSSYWSLDLQSRWAADQKKTDGDEGSAPHFPEIQEKYKNYARKGKLLMRKNHHHILCLQLLLNHKCCLKDSFFFTDIYEVTRHKLTYACVSTHKRTPQTEWGKWYGEGNAILQSTYYTLLPLSRNNLAFLYHCGLTKALSPFLQAASNLKQ